MCVIIVKPAGVNVPKKEFLAKAARANHDGCGFAASTGEYFRSTNFEEFWKAFRAAARKDKDIVLHFRWATHGSVCAENCHPFKGEFTNEEGEAQQIFFAHNGVLPIESYADMTDSEIAFRGVVLPTLERQHGFTESALADFLTLAGGSRFAFVGKEGVVTVGQFIDYEGLLLSNTRFFNYNPWTVRRSTNRFAGVGL